jgi:hypothetical protein
MGGGGGKGSSSTNVWPNLTLLTRLRARLAAVTAAAAAPGAGWTRPAASLGAEEVQPDEAACDDVDIYCLSAQL